MLHEPPAIPAPLGGAVVGGQHRQLPEGQAFPRRSLRPGPAVDKALLCGSGAVGVNGAAARKVQVGDVGIIASDALRDFEDAKAFRPWIVFPDTETNRLIR